MSAGSDVDGFDPLSYPEEEEDLDVGPERPRFLGDHSRGKRLVQAERDLIESLDSIENIDLAVHLYNAHALKLQTYGSADDRKHIKAWNRKQRWSQSGSNGKTWRPKASWTAWPLEPARITQQPRFLGDGSLRMRTNVRRGMVTESRPSGFDELEDCLHAELLRQSRLQCCQSQVVRADEHHPDSHSNGENHATKIAEAMPSSPPRFDYGEDLAGTAAARMHHHIPVVLADEEEAEKRGRAIVAHIVFMSEDLLEKLHIMRRNHFRNDSRNGGSASESETDTAEISRSRSRPRSAHEQTADDALPRDWSEVLGLATMTGWDAVAVKSATVRCASLFGEEMGFASMSSRHEDDANSKVSLGLFPAQVDASTHPPEVDFERLVCSMPACSRRGVPYKSAWRLNEHMKRNHGYKISLKAHRDAVSVEPEKFGGVHVDGYMRRIVAPSHWRPPRKYEGKTRLLRVKSESRSRNRFDEARMEVEDDSIYRYSELPVAAHQPVDYKVDAGVDVPEA